MPWAFKDVKGEKVKGIEDKSPVLSGKLISLCPMEGSTHVELIAIE